MAIITDTHAGVRNDHQAFHDNSKRFFDEVFFPTIDDQKIGRVLHLGDMIDRRKYINYVTARRLRTDFIEPMMARSLVFDHVLGNHDVYYRNTNEVNGVEELYHSMGLATDGRFRWHTDPVEIDLDGLKTLLVPWICSENQARSMDAIATSSASLCAGHLELAGFQMYKGSPAHRGLETSVFDKFDQTFSGHFHHQSTRGGVSYLGAHAEFTWSDYDDPRGFHVYDTNTRELEFHRNPFPMFAKVFYDDEGMSLKEVLESEDFESFAGKFVKVVVKSRTDPVAFDAFLSKLEKAGYHDMQVVDDHRNMDSIDETELLSESEDTLTFMRRYIAQSNTTGVDAAKIESFVSELYAEALVIE